MFLNTSFFRSRFLLRCIQLFTAILATLSPARAQRSADTSRYIVPEISYHGLDSLIRTNEYTGIYFWPTWCASCITEIPAVVDILRDKKSITLLLINEARSVSRVKKRLVYFPDVVKGYWRMTRIYYQQLIEINNLTEMRYFHEHFIRRKITKDELCNPAFFLLDKKGKLLWRTQWSFDLDSVRMALATYH